MKARFICLRFVVCVLFLPAWGGVAQAQPALGAFADVSAQWSISTVTNSASGALVAQPADANALFGEVTNEPRVGFPGRVILLDPQGALARASASVFPAPGEKFLRSSSYVSEAGPAGGIMNAIATARVVTQWLVTSDGSVVPSGSLVPLDATLSFDGFLFSINGNGSMAEVQATMNVYRDGIMTTVFQGGGQLERLLGSGQVLTESGAFTGDFTSSAQSRILQFNDSFNDLFSITVGELFDVELILQTHATGPINNGEMIVESYFYDSGNFLLSTGGVGGLTLSQINPIPEPEIYAMMAVGLGLLGWVGRRRKLKEAAA